MPKTSQSCCLLWVFWLYQASSTCPLPRVFPQIGFYFLSGYSLLSFLWLICRGEDNQKLAAYHVVSERLEFADLFSKASQFRLPTRLTNYSILVTNNSESGFAVDGVLITEAAVFVDTFIAIDFIASPLDFEMYGQVESKPSGSNSTLKSEWSFFPLCSLQLWLASSQRSLFFRAKVLKWANNFSITVGPFHLLTIHYHHWYFKFYYKNCLWLRSYFEELLKSSTKSEAVISVP